MILSFHGEDHAVNIFFIISPEILIFSIGLEHFVLVLVEAGVELVHVDVPHFYAVVVGRVVLQFDGLDEVIGTKLAICVTCHHRAY